MFMYNDVSDGLQGCQNDHVRESMALVWGAGITESKDAQVGNIAD